ncbi:aromatic ring-hydroxylating dioxygenase subunit alpha [Sphingobium sp. H39-3-25]|uniref:aromatic ring-hydroxylating dioxygenase subunit alpha n=1 Tax=Sphingomonadales TaxID=204457 RepID=UPI00082EB295|nr:aromatic ring-hydroxylating dioxygenase subunit alpha [Novosphingobium naphthalenivorans]MDF0546638.1 aromatic ring-hydroxylating dioxygenase subunit alpha [Sphingobium arseniciresistens]
MAFVRDLWYAAGWTQDVKRELLPRTIIGDHIVLYRTEAGEAIALSDTCPHRFAPMHLGKLNGDTIECGYHGLRFDRGGACVYNPHGNGATPRASHLRRYPLIEKNGLVWLWMGEEAAADPAGIPDFPWLDDETYAFTGSHTIPMALPCDLIVDNLLDLSHAAYLHPGTLGPQQGTKDVTSVRKEGTRIFSDRLIPGAPPAFVFTATGAATPDETVDYWANMRWDPPGSFYMDAGIVTAGGQKEDGRILSSVQIVIPATETSSYYHWKMFRNFAIDSAEVTAGIEAAVMQAFTTEDEPMIAAVHQRMAGREFWSMKPLLLSSDSAAVQARRVMADLLKPRHENESMEAQPIVAVAG